MDCAFGVASKKLLPDARSFRFSLISSSRGFIVLCFISLVFYKSMVCFELILSILTSRDITLPTKVHLVKAMVFSVVMYGCESCT